MCTHKSYYNLWNVKIGVDKTATIESESVCKRIKLILFRIYLCKKSIFRTSVIHVCGSQRLFYTSFNIRD